jgi:hypothetical protein
MMLVRLIFTVFCTMQQRLDLIEFSALQIDSPDPKDMGDRRRPKQSIKATGDGRRVNDERCKDRLLHPPIKRTEPNSYSHLL